MKASKGVSPIKIYMCIYSFSRLTFDMKTGPRTGYSHII